ncbi:hypothetical protein KL930_003637 [Ogataea haglerorum]|uniref:Uncharacterized protein n=1 Tax=Ogataea haglerorum TaxID=1937702 RepID=A0ABQ7REW4_9ASCO|nr:uncharacterized protein KL911_003229 [Ogataea haglerorum]KAG7695640.1 hypothetical protein KL915_003030 [Ogataea haglerorum]KAG7705607.1 hypothetical protein KL914_003445 [Ogataea haglerorum]KAG7707376.1 hypothetical protein KL950_003036 [Ogataea haglerorum]KAG7718328.1 hypothetical protein KL913_002323 [Ogataea haglerorum]KAG7718823.1 hypothetical protein KL949_002819 [Ogataea haglerorum]
MFPKDAAPAQEPRRRVKTGLRVAFASKHVPSDGARRRAAHKSPRHAGPPADREQAGGEAGRQQQLLRPQVAAERGQAGCGAHHAVVGRERAGPAVGVRAQRGGEREPGLRQLARDAARLHVSERHDDQPVHAGELIGQHPRKRPLSRRPAAQPHEGHQRVPRRARVWPRPGRPRYSVARGEPAAADALRQRYRALARHVRPQELFHRAAVEDGQKRPADVRDPDDIQPPARQAPARQARLGNHVPAVRAVAHVPGSQGEEGARHQRDGVVRDPVLFRDDVVGPERDVD